MREPRVSVQVAATRTVGDFTWAQRGSTVEDRGQALIGIALEWSGDGTHALNQREAVGHAAVQVTNMLAFISTHFGDRAALEVIADALKAADEWDAND